MRKAAISFVMSVRPHGTVLLPLEGSSWNFIHVCFSKIWRGCASLIETWQEKWVLYMKAYVHSWSHLAQFFLEWEMFQTKVVEKIETHILCSVIIFRKSCRLWDNAGENMAQRGRPQKTLPRMRIACWIPKATNTHSEYVILIAFPLQQWLNERASVLRYTYIACTVCVLEILFSC